MARLTTWLPLLLLASALFWTTALGFGCRSLRAYLMANDSIGETLEADGECFELSTSVQPSASAVRESLRLARPCAGPSQGVRMNLLWLPSQADRPRGGTSGVDWDRGEPPFGQTAW